MHAGIDQQNSAHLPKKISVLVVEDETLIRMLAVDSLMDAGFEVTGAVNAAEAIETLKSDTHVDFVFTDIMMPGSMNGIGLGAWIRENRPELSIAFTSGVARSSMLTLGLRENDAFFPKPVPFERLERHIRMIFQQAHSTVASQAVAS